MARRLVIVLVALALVLVACGGDDDSKDAGSTTSTSTSTSSTVATSSTSTTPERIAAPHALANIVLQIDNQLRPLAAASDPCIHGPRSDCVGRTLEAYKTLDDLTGAVELLQQSVTKGTRFYTGELPDDLVGLYDGTINAGAAAKEASVTAQGACLPQPTTSCDKANAALWDALIELYKQFNAWRNLA